jgi:hypothetical protein
LAADGRHVWLTLDATSAGGLANKILVKLDSPH